MEFAIIKLNINCNEINKFLKHSLLGLLLNFIKFTKKKFFIFHRKKICKKKDKKIENDLAEFLLY